MFRLIKGRDLSWPWNSQGGCICFIAAWQRARAGFSSTLLYHLHPEHDAFPTFSWGRSLHRVRRRFSSWPSRRVLVLSRAAHILGKSSAGTCERLLVPPSSFSSWICINTISCSHWIIQNCQNYRRGQQPLSFPYIIDLFRRCELLVSCTTRQAFSSNTNCEIMWCPWYRFRQNYYWGSSSVVSR